MGRGSQIRTKKHGARKNRRTTSKEPLPPPPKLELTPLDVIRTGLVKYGKVESQKLHEYKRGELYNASGNRVTKAKEAISMAAHEAVLEGARDVPGRRRVEKINEALERIAKKKNNTA